MSVVPVHCRVYFQNSHLEAMDRIHRLGQRRPVQAIKLVIEDSIENRIVELQEKKSAMVDAALSSDDSVRVPWLLGVIPLNGDVTAGDGPTYTRRCTSCSPSDCAII